MKGIVSPSAMTPHSKKGFTLIELPAMRNLRPCSGRAGFTLIELLVVVTIIVVLLALLVPAMNKAIYQATLTVCGAQMKGVGTGVTTYAVDARRDYPYRSLLANTPTAQFHKLTDPSNEDRPVLEKAFALDMLECPLSKSDVVDYEDMTDDSNMYIPYALYFGSAVKGPYAGGSMMKLGSRWGWDGKQYSVLLADLDTVDVGENTNDAAHPDDKGIMAFYHDRQALWPFEPASSMSITYAMWRAGTNYQRGRTDSNFAMADGSVTRIIGIRWDERMDSDGRVDGIPHNNDGSRWAESPTGKWQHVPKAGR